MQENKINVMVWHKVFECFPYGYNPRDHFSLAAQLFVQKFIQLKSKQYIKALHCWPYDVGILLKGPYPPCLRMADRALLAGHPGWEGWLEDSLHKGPVMQKAFPCHDLVMYPYLIGVMVVPTFHSMRDIMIHGESHDRNRKHKT